MSFPVFASGDVLNASDMNAVGLWKVASTTFSGTSFSINNCFTADYTNYRILISGSSTTNTDATFRFRVGGTDFSGANYEYASQGYYSGTRNDAAGIGQTSIGFTPSLGNGRLSSCSIDVFSPFTTATWKPLNANVTYTHNAVGVIVRNIAGALQSSTAYDGFSVISGGPTMTGTCTVYGYRI